MKNKNRYITIAFISLISGVISCLVILTTRINNMSKSTSTSDDSGTVNSYLPETHVEGKSSDSSSNIAPAIKDSNEQKETVKESIPLPAYESKTPNSPVTTKDTSSNVVLKTISINEYIANLNTDAYKVIAGETCSTILRQYEKSCNYNTAIKHIKLLNPNLNVDNLEIGTVVRIPKATFESGSLYKISSGDTWSKIAKLSYPNYDSSTIDFLIQINNLPNKDCPLGENIFIPKL